MTLLAVLMSIWLIAYVGSMEKINGMATPRCLYGFGLGVLLVRFRPNIGGTIAEAAAVALITAVLFFAHDTWTVAATPAFAVAIIVVSHQRGLISRVLKIAPFQLLGAISYAFYITHYFVARNFSAPLNLIVRGFKRHAICPSTGYPDCIVASGPTLVLIPVVFLALAVAVAWVTHLYLEVPAEKKIRQWIYGT